MEADRSLGLLDEWSSRDLEQGGRREVVLYMLKKGVDLQYVKWAYEVRVHNGCFLNVIVHVRKSSDHRYS